MKPFALLIAVFCFCGSTMSQESGRSFSWLPSLVPSSDDQKQEIVYRELTDLPNNQKGFIITNSKYPLVSRTSSELTEEQKEYVKAQDEFRKSVAEANKRRQNGGFRQVLPEIQQIPNRQFTVQDQTIVGMEPPNRPSQLFQAQIDPFNPILPPTFVKNSDLGQNSFQSRIQEGAFTQVKTPSQKIETIVQAQTEAPLFQRISPLQPSTHFVHTEQPIFVPEPNVHPAQNFPSLTQTQPNFAEPSRIKLQNEEQKTLLDDFPGTPTEDELFREQAENAKYSFQSSVSDTVNDNTHVREETRDGLKLTGLYSYSDGFFKRTVHYVADENGYRVIKQESVPIGTGPVHNPSGQIDVSTRNSGSSLQYTIKGDMLPKHRDSTLRVGRPTHQQELPN